MDAFYASIEERENPEFKGKPVIVGGLPGSRGVVSTCSYEARRYGVRSAMPVATAYRLCPNGIFIKPRIDFYEHVSSRIREIFHRYSDIVEPLSLDEAYIDVTENKINCPSATWIAGYIQKDIREEIHLSASAGVSCNKFLAKIASDVRKPGGLTVITPDKAESFLDNIPVRKFYGVGAVTEKAMHRIGIKTGADLKKVSLEDLIRLFGKAGASYYEIARGIDESPVCPERLRKSIGTEQTFQTDIDDMELIRGILKKQAEAVALALHEEKLKGKTVTLKVRYFDFRSLTRALTQHFRFDDAASIYSAAELLLAKTDAGTVKIRLLGLTVSNFYQDSGVCEYYHPELPF